jgi:hypothetical protein
MAKLVFTDNSQDWQNRPDFPKTTLTQVSWDTAPDTAVPTFFWAR